MNLDPQVWVAFITLIGILITAWVSWRVGKMQIEQQNSQQRDTDESDLHKTLLDLVEQQDQKIERQDTKIQRLEEYIDNQKTLGDELRRANFQLTLENKRLKDRIEELERGIASLKEAHS